MYEEHAMSAIYMDAEMSHHGDPGNPDSTESYHPGLVVEQLNKVHHVLPSQSVVVCPSQAESCASLHELLVCLLLQLQLPTCLAKLALPCSWRQITRQKVQHVDKAVSPPADVKLLPSCKFAVSCFAIMLTILQDWAWHPQP